MHLLNQSTRWHAYRGRDHIIIISTLNSNIIDHATCFHFLFEFCKYCIKITIEDTNNNYDVNSLHVSSFNDQDWDEVAGDTSWNLFRYLSHHNSVIAIPYPSSVHLPPTMTWSQFYQLRFESIPTCSINFLKNNPIISFEFISVSFFNRIISQLRK